MPRPKGSKNKTNVAKIKNKILKEKNVVEMQTPETFINIVPTDNNKSKCLCCGNLRHKDSDFYLSNSILLKGNESRMFVCKPCLQDLYTTLIKHFDDCKTAMYDLCRLLDVYFDLSLYTRTETQCLNSGENILQLYMKAINSLPQYRKKTFKDSSKLVENTKDVFEDYAICLSPEDKQNKEDVIRMVGYDPFENENDRDKKYLYNTLVDFLDESTLEDSFKLPIVIEIVKSFNQIDKINQALSTLTLDIDAMANQSSSIKALFETKNKIYSSILSMAKDNGISVNHSNNKSKGAGTLSGLMKQMQEKGFMEAEVNLFDIETAQGIRQVADISNESIRKQLQFDENDYVTMINDQRELILDLDKRLKKSDEENRILKLKYM